MSRIEELKEKYIKAADEAIAKGFKLSRHGAGYVDFPDEPICINAAASMQCFYDTDRPEYQEKAAEKLKATKEEVGAVEAGFCGWEMSSDDIVKLYNLGVELRTLYNA